MSSLQKILRDPAIWTLLGLNLFFIYEYAGDAEQYTTIVWLYWCQSVLIGLFNFLDMITMRRQNVDVSNLTINDRPATKNEALGCLPIFFLLHYGFFHVVYLVFLITDFKLANTDFIYLKWGIGAIILNLIIHFAQTKIKYSQVSRSIGIIIVAPYLRIVPMHLTILLPKLIGLTPGLTFLVLKTIFDLIGHLVTTPYYWRKDENPESGYI